MGVSSFTLVRPSALLCTCLVALMFCFPERCHAGKKGLPSVKHLFGVGIGYQRVVQYKPVLVISKHRRVKQQQQQNSGWGWNSGGGGGKTYSPIHIQQHVHKHGKGGPAPGYGHPPPQRHRRKRKRPHLFHSLSTGSSSGRGWGWRQGWRRPHRSYRKGHGGSGRNYGHGSDGGHNSYDSPVSQHPAGDHDYHQSPPHHEISEHSPSPHSEHGRNVWGASVGSSGAFYPSQSSTYFGSPYSSIEDAEDDHGGYESEVRENWNKDVSTAVDVSPSSTTTPSPTPSHYPFEDFSKSDSSVTSMHRDFLKTHMKNFRQFQHYQATTQEPTRDQEENHFAPLMLKAPGPYFSTMDPQSSEAEERGNAHYDEEYRDDDARENGGTRGFDEDYTTNFNELNKKMITLPQESTQSSVFSTTAQPTSPTTVVKNSKSNFHQVITTMPKNNIKKFKPSPRIDELGSGNSFNKPGFFPTFEQFKQINME